MKKPAKCRLFCFPVNGVDEYLDGGELFWRDWVGLVRIACVLGCRISEKLFAAEVSGKRLVRVRIFYGNFVIV